MKKSRKLALVVLGVVVIGSLVLVLASRPVLELACYRETGWTEDILIRHPFLLPSEQLVMVARRYRVLKLRWDWLPLADVIVYAYDDAGIVLKRWQR